VAVAVEGVDMAEVEVTRGEQAWRCNATSSAADGRIESCGEAGPRRLVSAELGEGARCGC
jgi:hypothetical protein